MAPRPYSARSDVGVTPDCRRRRSDVVALPPDAATVSVGVRKEGKRVEGPTKSMKEATEAGTVAARQRWTVLLPRLKA